MSHLTYAVLAILLAAAALSWAALVWRPMDDGMEATVTMGMSAPSFVGVWTVMMVAMMFPTAAPMILTFHAIASRRHVRGAFVSTWAFVAGYLLIWSLTGLAAYVLARGAEAAAGYFGDGACCFRPLRRRAPDCGRPLPAHPGQGSLPVEMSHARRFHHDVLAHGKKGAVQMGWRHGLYCFGCCWLLFAILFPLGMMNIAVMATITLLVFAEKTLPWGRRAAWSSALVLIVYGCGVIVDPQMLPTYASPPSMDMQNMDMDMDMPMPMDADPSRDLVDP